MSETTDEKPEVNPEEQKKQDNNKVAKKYEDNFSKTLALLKGNKDLLLKPSKASNDEMAAIMDEFFEEETKEKSKIIKEKIKTVITANVNFEKEIRKAEQDLQNLIINKKKEMNKTFEDLFKEIKDINSIQREFHQLAKRSEEAKHQERQQEIPKSDSSNQ